MILLVYFAAELRILLVYLSEILGRLGKNGGTEGHIFHWAPPVEPPLGIQNFSVKQLVVVYTIVD